MLACHTEVSVADADSLDPLHMSERYRIGIHTSLNESEGVDQIARDYSEYLEVRMIPFDI